MPNTIDIGSTQLRRFLREINRALAFGDPCRPLLYCAEVVAEGGQLRTTVPCGELVTHYCEAHVSTDRFRAVLRPPALALLGVLSEPVKYAADSVTTIEVVDDKHTFISQKGFEARVPTDDSPVFRPGILAQSHGDFATCVRVANEGQSLLPQFVRDAAKSYDYIAFRGSEGMRFAQTKFVVHALRGARSYRVKTDAEKVIHIATDNRYTAICETLFADFTTANYAVAA